MVTLVTVVEEVAVLLHFKVVQSLKLAVQTKFLHGFSWSLQATAEIVSQIRALLLRCTFLPVHYLLIILPVHIM